MRHDSQINGYRQPPTGRKHTLRFAWRLHWLWVGMLVCGMATDSTQAQTLRLGSVDLFLQGTFEVGYNSNVDDTYPDEEKESLDTGDFYLMPGLRLSTQKIPFFRNSTLSFDGQISYQDYLSRNDLDTELYFVKMGFDTILPRMQLGGQVGSEFTVDASEDQYVPGGVNRDPKLVNSANAYINWHHRKLRLETSVDYTTERHDYEEYQIGDKDETVSFAGAYLDIFTWGSFVYSWEHTYTDFIQTDKDIDKILKNFGFDGAIPLTWLAHPHITYSVGVESDDDTDDEQRNGTWEPSHSVRAEDELQFTKEITLSGYIQWDNKVYDDDIGFTYFIQLEQLLGSRARHALSFTQEPQAILGSNKETEKTTYDYSFKINDLFIYNLSLYTSLMYELQTPLSDINALTEKTTTFLFGFNHTRNISRQLSRIASYEYSLMDSNFHHDGNKQKHMLTYGLSYDF